MRSTRPCSALGALVLLAGLPACAGKTGDAGADAAADAAADAGDAGDGGESDCDRAAAVQGREVCVHEIPDEATWKEITVPADSFEQTVVTKFMTPATPAAPLATLFMISRAFRRHFDFLAQSFPDLYGDLTPAAYLEMVIDPEKRLYFGGNLAQYVTDDGLLYGFTVWDDPKVEENTVTYEQVLLVWGELASRFGIGKLCFVPEGPNQRAALAGWDPAFPVYDPER